MLFKETPLQGAYLIEPEKREDHRGYFARSFCREMYQAHGLNPHIEQANLSHSREKFTLRGFHYQVGAAAEAKSIRCISGSILDVIIDLREDSPTQGAHYMVELSEKNGCMLYVPEGFAHAFITLVENTSVYYLVSAPYTPALERGIRWDDPFFGISWPTAHPVLSEKDTSHPLFH